MDGFEEMGTVLEEIEVERETTAVAAPEVLAEEASNEESVPEKTYGCDHVARVIGAPAQTVRNYTRDYDEFLETGRGENGQRTYTKHDMGVLKRIHDMRTKEHRNRKEIRRYLENATKPKNTPAVRSETELIASAVSVELHDKIKAFFDIGMQGISKQVGRLSTHMDSMEGAVKKQKEEMRRLREQNEELRQQVEENKRAVQLLAKDMERRASEHLEALNSANNSITAIEKGAVAEQISKNVGEKIDRMMESQKGENDLLAKTIREAVGGRPSDEERAQYEKARNTITKLASEVDRKNAEVRMKNAQIEELLREKEELQAKSKGFSRFKRKKSQEQPNLITVSGEQGETQETEPEKSLDAETNYVNSLKTVAQGDRRIETSKTNKSGFLGLRGKVLKQQHA